MAYNIYNTWTLFDGYNATAETLGNVDVGLGYRPKSGTGSISNNNLGITSGNQNIGGTIILELGYAPGPSGTSNTSYVGVSASLTNPTKTEERYWVRDENLIPFPYNHTSTPIPAYITGSNLPKTAVFSYHNIRSGLKAFYPKWAGTATSTESNVPYAEVGGTAAYFNEWASLTSKDGNSFYYAITTQQSNVWAKATLSVSAGYKYTFELGTYSQADHDGILISTSNLSSGTINTTSGRIGRCSGIHATSSCEYTPSSNGTVYIYFMTDSIYLGDVTLNYTDSGHAYNDDDGYTYGNVKVTKTSVMESGYVSTAPTNNSPAYNSGNYLCTAGSGTGPMYYRLGTSGSFSINRPTTSGLSCGSYTVYYYAGAAGNYTQSSTGSLTVTVTNAAGSVSTAPANRIETYGSGGYLCTAGSGTGTMYYRLGDSGSFSTTRPTTSGLNAGSYTLYYYAAASGCYNQSSTGSITVTIQKADGSVSPAPADNGATYGSGNPLCTPGSGTGTMYYKLGTSGTYSTTIPTASSSLNVGTYTLYYYAAESTNYKQYSATYIRVTVTQATGSVSTAPTNSNPTCDSGNYLCTAGSGTGTMYYKVDSGSYSTTRPTTSGLCAGSHTVYYYAAESTNYTQSGTGSITVTIASKSGSVSTAPADNGATYGSGNPLCTPGSGTGTMMYKLGSNGTYSSTRPTTSGLSCGSYTLYYYSAASCCYTATSEASITVTIGNAAGSVSTAPANNGATYGSGDYLCTAGSGTGTMYYRLGTSGNFSTTRPTTSGLNAGSYTVYYYSAASGCYNQSSTGSITVTVGRASNQITISPTSNTIYNSNTFYLTVSNHKGTPIASASPSGIVTIGSFDSTNSRFLVTYSSAGSTTITVIDSSTNYATSEATCSVTTKVDTVINYDYNSSNSGYTVDVSIGSGLTAGESSATVSVSGSHTHTYYYLYASGLTTGPYYTYPSDSPTWSITSQDSNTSGKPITRFSKSGNTLSHSSMGTTTGTDYVTITANNNGTTKTASTNVTNSVTNYDYNSSNSSYTVDVSIGSGLTAGESSATVSVSGSHTHTYYYLYTTGSTSGPYYTYPSDSPSWSITSQYLNSSSNPITRFSKSSNTLSHATMCETLGTDYVTITATNNTATKTASTNVTNTRWDTNLSSYWASISITNKNGITCAGGSSSVSVSAGHLAKYTYTSGCVSSDTHSVSDGVTWSITSNGNDRFSKSGNTLSHNPMGTSVTTDAVTVTAVNDNSSSAKATDTTSVSNTITNSNYNPSGYWSSVSIGNGMTCSGGSATVTASAGHVAYNYYCSGSVDSDTHSVSDSVSWSITSNGNSRFSKSGNTLSHDNMTTNGVIDTVTVTAVNGNSSSATSTDSKSISNPITNTNYSPSNYTASVSIGSGLTAAGGSATVTASASHLAYDLYCSGSYNNQHTVSDSVSWSITSNGNSRFSKSGNTLSHDPMGCNATTDTVTVTAVNESSSSATATASKSIINEITNSNYSPSNYTVSVSIGSGLTAAGGSATVTATASHKAYNYYTSGSYCGQHDVADTAKWRITSNGNSRFSHPSSGGSTISAGGSNITVYNSGTSVSHSSMGTNVTTDTVTVTAYNTSNTATSSTASKSITNALESITFTVDSTSVPYQGSTTGYVEAYYTSTSHKTVSNSSYTTYTDAAGPDIVTFTKNS